MKAALLTVACVLLLASPAAAKNLKVYIFVAPEGRVVGVSEGFTSAALADSADDLRKVFDVWQRNRGLAVTTRRPEARVVVQVTRREEAEGDYRVHAQVTLDGSAAELTGTSTHQWKIAAGQIAEQLQAWAQTALQDDRNRVEAAAMRRRQQPAVDR